MLEFSQRKFTTLTLKQQHKIASRYIKRAYFDEDQVDDYNTLASWMGYKPLSSAKEAIADRYHEHLIEAGIFLKEHDLLPNLKHKDTLSSAPHLNYHIYLDRLRSAHNVGSILRTVEAFRLGSIHFDPKTPTDIHKKVKRSAMGCEGLVPTDHTTPLSKLPRPWIAVETTTDAIPLYDFTFPPGEGTLFLGNEELGLSSNILSEVDEIVEIPLVGSKNSLNVAVAFGIIACEIQRQMRDFTHLHTHKSTAGESPHPVSP